jgi:hypothetical protein
MPFCGVSRRISNLQGRELLGFFASLRMTSKGFLIIAAQSLEGEDRKRGEGAELRLRFGFRHAFLRRSSRFCGMAFRRALARTGLVSSNR